MEITFKDGTVVYVAGGMSMQAQGRMVVLKDASGNMIWAGNSLYIKSMLPKPSPRA